MHKLAQQLNEAIEKRYSTCVRHAVGLGKENLFSQRRHPQPVCGSQSKRKEIQRNHRDCAENGSPCTLVSFRTICPLQPKGYI